MSIIAYEAFQTGGPPSPLKNNDETVIVRLRVPNAGNFVVFGKVTVANLDGSTQSVLTALTTLDGATVLDTVYVNIGNSNFGNLVSISLLGSLVLPSLGANEIVDIRCSTTNGYASFGKLLAISVDSIMSGSLL